MSILYIWECIDFQKNWFTFGNGRGSEMRGKREEAVEKRPWKCLWAQWLFHRYKLTKQTPLYFHYKTAATATTTSSSHGMNDDKNKMPFMSYIEQLCVALFLLPVHNNSTFFPMAKHTRKYIAIFLCHNWERTDYFAYRIEESTVFLVFFSSSFVVYLLKMRSACVGDPKDSWQGKSELISQGWLLWCSYFLIILKG